jgi:hypothetical protein
MTIIPLIYEIGVIGIAITNWVKGKMSIIVAYFVDFIWASTCNASYSIGTSVGIYFSYYATM